MNPNIGNVLLLYLNLEVFLLPVLLAAQIQTGAQLLPSQPDHLPADIATPDTAANHQDEVKLIPDHQLVADHQLLPDTLPEGDPLDYARPIFLTEPEDSYVIKSRPAELSCKVVHAIRVHIQCNDDIQKQARTQDYTQRGINITEATVKITRDQVEEFFGDYHCACVAWSNKGSAKSRLALVTIAFLKKEFETPPYSDQTRVGQQLEVRCHPPKGKPKPAVYWLKDGVRLREPDDNHIVTQEGHLILVTARQQDAGNYTCVADNLAAKRYSKPAEISIFANGGWSAWSSWSACSVTCGQGIQQRGRICSQDKPCAGKNIEQKQCEVPCKGVDGSWSSWSAWSSCSRECTQISCSSQCTQTRRRACDNPPPSNGGHFCFGVDYDARKCSDSCIEPAAPLSPKTGSLPPQDGSNGVWVEPAIANETKDVYSIGSNEIALYIGLSLAVLVFLIVILVAISLVRRRRLPHGYALTQTGYESNHEKKKSGYSPDLTPGNTEIASVCYEYSYSDSNSNHSKNGYLSAREHHYEQPMVLLPASRSAGDGSLLTASLVGRSPVDSMAKPLISDTSSSSAGGNISPRSAGTFDRSPSGGNINHNNNINHPTAVTSMTPPPRTTAYQPDVVMMAGFTRWCAVTSHAGGRISLPESGITLTVPEGAIPPGHTQDLYLSVVHDTKCYPNLSAGGGSIPANTTLLSPVVVVGPTSAARLLQKPVILSFPHVASLRHGGWTISVMRSADTDTCESWRSLVTLGQENINTTVYTQLDLNTCHIMTDTLGGYCLIGQSAPPPSLPAFKSLRIAAFAQEYSQGTDLTVRLYCVPDTDDAIKFVQETEKQFGGRLLDKPVSALLQAGGHNLRLSLERLCEGWCVQPGASVQEVPFSHLWSVSSNPNLHCSFALRRSTQNNSCIKQHLNLGLQISVQQQGNNDKCLLKVNTTIATCKTGNGNGCNGRNSGDSGGQLSGMRTSSSNCSSSNDSYSALNGQVFRLPGQTKEGLARLLDAPVKDGNDWRLLAERLNVHRYPAFFGSRPSPTEAILNLWEAKNRESSATQGLLSILRGMRRMDCVRLLEQDLQMLH